MRRVNRSSKRFSRSRHEGIGHRHDETPSAWPESVRFEQTLTGAVLEATNRALHGHAA